MSSKELGSDLGFYAEPRSAGWTERVNFDRLMQLMAAKGIDIIVASSALNVGYLANLDNPSTVMGLDMHVIFAAHTAPHGYVVLPVFELPDFVECSPDYLEPVPYIWRGLRYFEETREPQVSPPSDVERAVMEITRNNAVHGDALGGLIGALRMVGVSDQRIGVERGVLDSQALAEIEETFPRASFEAADALLRSVRSVKTEVEIAILRQASAINAAAIGMARDSIRVGIREDEVARIWRDAIVDAGARPEWASIKFGSESSLPHRRATLTPARPRDILRFEVGCTWTRYYSDMARCYVIGEPTSRQTTYYEALRAGQVAAMDALRPGALAKDVFQIGVDAARSAGIPHLNRGHVGHGCGLHLYDDPLLAPDHETLIESGMVLAVELPYFELGWGGWNLEDVVVVTDDGAEPLVRFEAELALSPQ